MAMLKEVVKVPRKARFLARRAWQVKRFLRSRITVEQAIALIARGVAERNDRFLRKLEHAVYENARSPYRKLLQAAGCELGDVRKLVDQSGLESTLRKLADAGVYLTFEEYRCWTPTVRSGRTFEFEPENLDDPRLHPQVIGRTGGSRGKPGRTTWAFSLVDQWAPHYAVFFAANGCVDVPLVFWTPGHAEAAEPMLSCVKFGQQPLHWFICQDPTGSTDRVYAMCKLLIDRRAGRLPSPERTPYARPQPVLDCIVALLARGKGACLSTTPSSAVKLSQLALSQGTRLDGLTCLLGAEPLTPARRETIESSGAKAAPLYGSSEAIWVGGHCGHAEHDDEVHVLADGYAVIAGKTDDEMDGGSPLLFTSFSPLTSKILLNTDIGDRGMLGERSCDCVYGRMGCRRTIHMIRSSDKITEFGVTFQVPDVFRVLEEALPRRLGGRTGDYQLIEERNRAGLPKYTIRVHPNVTGVEGDTVKEAFLSELAAVRSYYGFMAEIWRKEGIVHTERGVPLASRRGKVLPFHRSSGSSFTFQ